MQRKGMVIIMKYRLEYSLLLALAVTLLCCAILPQEAHAWWGAAFSPLCDGILTAEGEVGKMILRSRLWELLMQLKT